MKSPNEDALGQIVELACGLIDFDPRNRKEHDKEALQSLAESIKAEGLLQPIVVRGHPEKPARYMLIAGERRLRAHLLNKAETISARVAKHDPNTVGAAGAARKRLVENLQREDLTPIEEARGYRELAVDFKLTHKAIADLAGVSQPVVSVGYKVAKLIPPSEAAYFHYVFGLANVKKRDEFFGAVATGLGLTASSPAYHLRERLQADRAAQARMQKRERYALIIKAWNAHHAGAKMERLRFTNIGEAREPFPAIAGVAPERSAA